jgi:hypothetical protein
VAGRYFAPERNRFALVIGGQVYLWHPSGLTPWPARNATPDAPAGALRAADPDGVVLAAVRKKEDHRLRRAFVATLEGKR